MREREGEAMMEIDGGDSDGETVLVSDREMERQ